MKKIIALLLAVFVLAVALAGCGEDVSVAPGATESAATVAVDVSQLWDRGEIIIFNGASFIHERNVVDYVEGDPAGLVPKHDDVFGLYSVRHLGSNEVTTYAILNNGKQERLDKSYALLPKTEDEFVLGPGGNDRMSASIQDDGTYKITITRKGKDPIIRDKVVDAWSAWGHSYWLIGDTAYCLDWENPKAQPEMYFEGANGISHCSDEAEGALVPLEKANYKAYGRDDIYSPYGDRLSK